MSPLSRLAARLRPGSAPNAWAPLAVVRALRRPSLYWSLTGLLTLVTLWTIGDLTGDARAALAAWGERERVLVVTSPIAPGEALTPSAVELREVPVALLPDGAVRVLPEEPVARVELFAGEVVVRQRLAGGGSGIAALVPDDAIALAVPVGAGVPPVVVGDLVDVIATFAVAPDQAGEPSLAVARGAGVVHVGEQSVTVAVAASEVADVAFALTHAVVTLALVG